MDKTNTIFLSDQRKIMLDDKDDIILSFISDNQTKDTFVMSYPVGGYGGGWLQLSPSKNYCVFSYFSGESEEAFSLFNIEHGRLKFLYDSGYLYGEDAHYNFADNEKILVQTFRTDVWYQENAKIDENGDVYYEFGELNLLSLETYEFSRHPIYVYPSADWEEEETDIGPFMFSGSNDSQLRVIMPWGEAVFCKPLQNILVVKPSFSHSIV